MSWLAYIMRCERFLMQRQCAAGTNGPRNIQPAARVEIDVPLIGRTCGTCGGVGSGPPPVVFVVPQPLTCGPAKPRDVGGSTPASPAALHAHLGPQTAHPPQHRRSAAK